MKTLLIAIDSEIIAGELENELSGMFQVFTCYNGCDALMLIGELRPDIVVLDLMLSGMEGLSVLQAARNVGVSSKFVIISKSFTDYVIEALEKLQVAYLMRMGVGCVSGLTARILDIAQWDMPESDINTTIRNILVSLGVKISSPSYRFLETAVQLHIADPKQHIVSQLYPAVAEKCNGTPTQVEKSISRTIDAAMSRCSGYLWQMYFPSKVPDKLRKPSNLEFFRTVAECVINQTQSPKERETRSRIAL